MKVGGAVLLQEALRERGRHLAKSGDECSLNVAINQHRTNHVIAVWNVASTNWTLEYFGMSQGKTSVLKGKVGN
uniref:Glyco_hydro_30C domain-containing protein n=1 Tax=Heterorhabditis bacteriophora TaxID=37862 RepID=A0A1I7WZ38_HETBA